MSDYCDRATTERTTYARIAVLIPCYNEELTISKVVRDFRRALTKALVYVYDNNSCDRNRGGAHDSRPRAAHPDNRSGYSVQGPSRGLGQQTAHLPRRGSHLLDDSSSS